MVYDIVDLFAIELMKNWNGDGPIGEGCQKTDSPMGRVTSADGNFVSLLNSTVLEKDMYLLYFACYIVELERNALVVSQSILIPVFGDGLLDISIETAKLIHENCTIFEILCKDTAISAHSQKKCAIFYAF